MGRPGCVKVTYKKKTVFWLSAWDGYFKTTFYFTEKTAPGIDNLELLPSIRDDFKNTLHIGKLIPLTIEFRDAEMAEDFYKIVAYNKVLNDHCLNKKKFLLRQNFLLFELITVIATARISSSAAITSHSARESATAAKARIDNIIVNRPEGVGYPDACLIPVICLQLTEP